MTVSAASVVPCCGEVIEEVMEVARDTTDISEKTIIENIEEQKDKGEREEKERQYQ